MKKNLLLSMLFLLCSCANLNSSSLSCSYDNDDVKELHIEYFDMFSLQKSYYFVYFYQINCLHCLLIKDVVIEYALSNYGTLFLILYDEKIPLFEDVSDTIGLNSVDGFGILGTPTLILIKDHKIFLNVAGEDLIKSVLNEYN